MLTLKKNHKRPFIINEKLNLFGRDDTRQAKSPIFIVVTQAEEVPRAKKTKRDVMRT